MNTLTRFISIFFILTGSAFGERAPAFQQERDADLVIFFRTVNTLHVLRPEIAEEITKPEHLPKLQAAIPDKNLVVIIIGKTVAPENFNRFADELVDRFLEVQPPWQVKPLNFQIS